MNDEEFILKEPWIRIELHDTEREPSLVDVQEILCCDGVRNTCQWAKDILDQWADDYQDEAEEEV